MELIQVLDKIDTGEIALPEFQRGYVWNREQVRGLFTSLYRRYPIGGFMTWNTRAESASRGEPGTYDGTVKLLLDGQQRATTLYGVIRGKAPNFFEGNVKTFSGLHFNVVDQTFEFYMQSKMKDNPIWIDVTDLMQHGIASFIPRIQELTVTDPAALGEYIARLNRLDQVKHINVNVEEVTGEDKTVDVVVDIFNRVNSGGTKLSKGDLALAKICASWPQAREQMNTALSNWRSHQFDFKLEWLLRNVNAYLTGQSLFSALADVDVAVFQDALTKTVKIIDQLLNMVSGRLGLDHDRVLFGRYAFPVMVRFLRNEPSRMVDAATRDKLLYWYIHAGMWGRFAGSTESVLQQDLKAVDDGGLDALIATMSRWRGDLTVREADFAGQTIGARFYPVLYLLTRTGSAQDFGTGLPLVKGMLGATSGLEIHHVFPKAQLYKAGYGQAQVNAVANYAFLTKGTNIAISDDDPAVYLPAVAAAQPGALESQWVPSDRSLWRVDRYMEFLESRRVLLAATANGFLSELLHGTNYADLRPTSVDAQGGPPTGREADLDALLGWMRENGYSEPQRDTEVVDSDTGRVLAVAEAYWPAGLQEGIGEPIVLELDPDEAELDELAAQGTLVFTGIGGLREFIERLQVAAVPSGF